MILLQAEERGCDKWGCGHYGAPRGNRTHKGVDFLANTKQTVLSSVSGEVTKLGYPYSNDLAFRYVQITDKNGLNIRYFYIEPIVNLGDMINVLDPLGTVQNLKLRYNNINNHVHIEIKDNQGKYIDPHKYFS